MFAILELTRSASAANPPTVNMKMGGTIHYRAGYEITAKSIDENVASTQPDTRKSKRGFRFVTVFLSFGDTGSESFQPGLHGDLFIETNPGKYYLPDTSDIAVTDCTNPEASYFVELIPRKHEKTCVIYQIPTKENISAVIYGPANFSEAIWKLNVGPLLPA
jgi:hypothetical protein